MKLYPSSITDALAERRLLPRDFLWVQPRDRSSGLRVGWGAWSGHGTIAALVNDPVEGEVARPFVGAGSMVEVSDVAIIAGLTVQTIEITLSGIDPASEALVRTYDPRFAPVTLFRGWMKPNTVELVAAAQVQFLGFVDGSRVVGGEDGGPSSVQLTCASHVQELTRKGTATRSDADQRRRLATDGFFRHAATVGTWQIKWEPKT